MPSPDSPVPGHILIAQLGQGSCGEVWLAKSADGTFRALKSFKAMGINRRLLQGAHARLAEAGGHPSLVKIHTVDFEQRPAWLLMDFHGQNDASGPASWTLEDWMGQEMESGTIWQIIRQIADGLAFLHRIGVAHANLHPRNVLIRDPETGRIALNDFSQGWVEGVYHLEGTEAMLYASPEQLRDPSGIEQGVWGGWDVFAFGTLAFRLLTGRFPREDAARRRLETARREDRPISPGDVLPLFPSGVAMDWGDRPARDWEEAAHREIIERCLVLDPDGRFKDMREVLADFFHIDEERELREERDRIRALRLREVGALGFARRMALVFGVCSSVATLAALVYANKYRIAAREAADLKVRFSHALAEKDLEITRRETEARRRERTAKAEAAGAVKEASAIKETLIRSQEQADALFAVVRDRRPAKDPGFKDIRQTAEELSRFYQDFLAGLSKETTFDSERARAMDNLAELARAAEDPEKAVSWQKSANVLWEKLSSQDPAQREYRSRLAGGLLATGQASLKDGQTVDAASQVKRARALLEELASQPPSEESTLRQLAACYLQQGRIERQEGRTASALELYRAASDQLRLLTKRTGRFDYRSALASSYVETGELARGIDDLEKAANIQRAALAQLVSMVEEKPEVSIPRLDLARAYGELGEIETEAGNPDKAATLLENALGLVDGVLAEEPASEIALYEKARRSSALARIHRDQGKRPEAEKLVATADKILGELAKEPASNPAYRHQLALVWWQKAELKGDLNQAEEAIATMRQAMEVLDEVAANNEAPPDLRHQVRVSKAYLTGELGHRLEESNQRNDAAVAFKSAVEQWQAIAKDHGEDSMTTDALAWCTRRLESLESPANP